MDNMVWGGLSAALALLALFGGIALLMLIDGRSKAKERELAHAERMRGLELGRWIGAGANLKTKDQDPGGKAMPRKILLALVSFAAIGTWNGCSRQRAEPEGAKDDPPPEKRKGPKWEDPRKCTDLHRSAVVELDHVEVENGRLRVVTEKAPPWSAGFSEWEFEKTPLGTHIYLSTWRERSGKRGLYLSYDHQGKDRRVSLVREPGPGCYWEWTEGPRVEGPSLDVLGPTGPGGPYYTIPCQAKPVDGPFKGWSLTSEGADVVLAKSPKNQFAFTANINGPYSK